MDFRKEIRHIQPSIFKAVSPIFNFAFVEFVENQISLCFPLTILTYNGLYISEGQMKRYFQQSEGVISNRWQIVWKLYFHYRSCYMRLSDVVWKDVITSQHYSSYSYKKLGT